MFHALMLAFTLSSGGVVASAPSGIACKLQGRYIGNIINAEFSLVIEDSKTSRWEYRSRDDHSGTQPATVEQASGDYRIDGDLAVFSGRLTPGDHDVRFGVNFARCGGDMQFNRFFPQADGRMTWQRAWYAKKDGAWRLVEAMRLSFATPDLKKLDDRWAVHFQGEHLTVAADGAMQRRAIDRRDVYRKESGLVYFRGPGNQPPFGLPTELHLVERDGRLQYAADGAGTIFELNGFHPRLHQR